MTLTQFYFNAYDQSGNIPSGEGNKRMNRLQQFDYMSQKSSFKERLEIFNIALVKLEADFGSWEIPWESSIAIKESTEISNNNLTTTYQAFL